ncbi:hypothetical protein [Homoserinimonas hongtaonis]|uniref:hypothetical protein n=1 Tax=Homoserinimonas hongtaonis TaxID=2079791 RepID=UPI00131F23B4|nr:hypothetical protein [Salinibacterium hongtaonis]
MLTPQNDVVTQAVALMQRMFKDVGIEMTSSVVTPSTLVVAALTGESKAVAVEGGIAPETLRRAGQTLVTNAGVNFGRGGYTEMDALLAASRDTKSEDERATTISEIQQLAAEWVHRRGDRAHGVSRTWLVDPDSRNRRDSDAHGCPGQVLPNVVVSVVAYSMTLVAVAIATEGGLSFLGLGIPAPESSWGSMTGEGCGALQTSPHIVLVPAASPSALAVPTVSSARAARASRSRLAPCSGFCQRASASIRLPNIESLPPTISWPATTPTRYSRPRLWRVAQQRRRAHKWPPVPRNRGPRQHQQPGDGSDIRLPEFREDEYRTPPQVMARTRGA